MEVSKSHATLKQPKAAGYKYICVCVILAKHGLFKKTKNDFSFYQFPFHQFKSSLLLDYTTLVTQRRRPLHPGGLTVVHTQVDLRWSRYIHKNQGEAQHTGDHQVPT